MIASNLIRALLTTAALGSTLTPIPAAAHFQMLYPGEAARAPGKPLDLLLVFTHPFHGAPTMQMGVPEAFYMVSQRGDDAEPVEVDLIPRLEPIQWMGADGTADTAYSASLPAREVRSLGDYVLVLEPAPYYEATEDKFIQQYTKTILNVGGVPGNWEKDIGLPAEIRPLDKPYANWVGGVFRGIVLSNGEPVPFAEIEIEYVNHEPSTEAHSWVGEPHVSAPHPSLEAQSIRADANGNFAIGLPKAGWWGIAALDIGPVKQHQGKPLSQDAVLWVEATAIE